METVLHALAGCAAVDMVSILEKMRQPLQGLRVEISAERAEDHPRVFTTIQLRYLVSGDVDPKKAERAAKLSEEKFCSVSAMLKPGVVISHDVVVEG
jgi:putative redox protein